MGASAQRARSVIDRWSPNVLLAVGEEAQACWRATTPGAAICAWCMPWRKTRPLWLHRRAANHRRA